LNLRLAAFLLLPLWLGVPAFFYFDASGSSVAGLEFEELAGLAGIAVRNLSGTAEKPYIVESTGSGGCFFDYDGDGFLDLYVVNGSGWDKTPDEGSARDALYRNRGDGTFIEVTESAGIREAGWGAGCAVADIDNDGDPDLYLTQFGPNVLYLNLGDGTFRDVTDWAGVADPRVSSSAAFSDLNGDGFVDLLVGAYLRFEKDSTPRLGDSKCFYRGVEVYCGPDGLPSDYNSYFVNRGDGTFTDHTREAGLFNDQAKTLGLLLSDLDGDGKVDVYAACDSTINLFFRNRGGGRFEDQSLISGAGYSGRGFEQSGMGVTAGDPDGDGDWDLFVTNFQNDTNTFYLNRGRAEFEDATERLGLGAPSIAYLGWGTHFADFDHDGDEDLFVANGHVYPQAEKVGEPYRQRNQIFENQGQGRWAEAKAWGPAMEVVKSGRGTALGDFDNDGRLDLFVNNIDDLPSLFRSRGGGGRGSIQLLLVGVAANRDGLGARVALVAAGRTQFREVRFCDGYLGSNDPRLHFGLGDAPRAETVHIRWPDGREETVANLEPGPTHVIKQGQGLVASRSPSARR
jgi:hypothetical protein